MRHRGRVGPFSVLKHLASPRGYGYKWCGTGLQSAGGSGFCATSPNRPGPVVSRYDFRNAGTRPPSVSPGHWRPVNRRLSATFRALAAISMDRPVTPAPRPPYRVRLPFPPPPHRRRPPARRCPAASGERHESRSAPGRADRGPLRPRLRARPPLRRGTGSGRHHPPATPLGSGKAPRFDAFDAFDDLDVRALSRRPAAPPPRRQVEPCRAGRPSGLERGDGLPARPRRARGPCCGAWRRISATPPGAGGPRRTRCGPPSPSACAHTTAGGSTPLTYGSSPTSTRACKPC